MLRAHVIVRCAKRKWLDRCNMRVLRYEFERQCHRKRLGLGASVLLCAMLLTAGCEVQSPNMDDLGLTPGISGITESVRRYCGRFC